MKQKPHLLTVIFWLTISFSFAQSSKPKLAEGGKFSPGQTFYSQNKECKLWFQDEVLVISQNDKVIWKSDMSGSWAANRKIDELNFLNGEIKCFFQNKLQWSSQTNFHNAHLVLGNDGIIKIESKDNELLWENFAVMARSVIPPLMSVGDEGPFTEKMIPPTNKLNLYVLFVDWVDAKATTKNFDSIWNLVTSNQELFKSLEKQGRAIGLKVKTNIKYQWKTLPHPTSYYFPPETASDLWNWESYIKDCPAILPEFYGVDSFDNNSLIVVLPNPEVKNKWKKDVPSGNLPISFLGLRSMISISPHFYGSKYTSLMHEIGHGYGSGDLYTFPPFNWYDAEMMGLDVMGDSHMSTGFMGYHRYRYGWIPFNKEKPRTIYLTEPHSYGVTLTSLSSDDGISMVLIPDQRVSNDSLTIPSALWGIEIAQDVQSTEQYYAGKNEKIVTEGEKIIIYKIEYPEPEGKRSIRLIPKKSFDKETDRWSNVFLYRDGDTFSNPSAPMEMKIRRNDDGTFYLEIALKPRS